jgi:hypothetical protein
MRLFDLAGGFISGMHRHFRPCTCNPSIAVKEIVSL